MTTIEIKEMTLDHCKGCKGMVSKGVRAKKDGVLESCECAIEFEKFRKYNSANIEPEYWRMSEEDYDDTFKKNNKKTLEDVAFFITNAKECVLNNVHLVFHGKNGLGKTVVAYQIIKKLLDENINAYYITASRLADLTFTDKEAIDELKKHNFIVLDELDKFTGKNQESLMRLSNLICDELMRTSSMIFITNEPIEQLRLLGYSNSLISRLEGVEWLEFKGQNLRKHNLSKFAELKENKCRQ